MPQKQKQKIRSVKIKWLCHIHAHIVTMGYFILTLCTIMLNTPPLQMVCRGIYTAGPRIILIGCVSVWGFHMIDKFFVRRNIGLHGSRVDRRTAEEQQRPYGNAFQLSVPTTTDRGRMALPFSCLYPQQPTEAVWQCFSAVCTHNNRQRPYGIAFQLSVPTTTDRGRMTLPFSCLYPQQPTEAV